MGSYPNKKQLQIVISKFPIKNPVQISTKRVLVKLEQTNRPSRFLNRPDWFSRAQNRRAGCGRRQPILTGSSNNQCEWPSRLANQLSRSSRCRATVAVQAAAGSTPAVPGCSVGQPAHGNADRTPDGNCIPFTCTGIMPVRQGYI